MKPSLIIAMLGLLFVGVWLVARPIQYETRPGSTLHQVSLGRERGVFEVTTVLPGDEPTFRVLLRDGHVSGEVSAAEFKRLFGPDLYRELTSSSSNWLFNFFRITSWGSLAWITLGFAGQMAFFGRMVVQWLVSEKQGRSVVPAVFWWLSLFGGAALFAYFVWRQDLIGVIGQTSGVVIYARNIRLIHRERNGTGELAASGQTE